MFLKRNFLQNFTLQILNVLKIDLECCKYVKNFNILASIIRD
jgi:hypothetical protein